MNKKFFYIKILIVIVLSIVAVKIITPEIFLANTPRFRPDLNNYLASKANDLFGSGNFIANLFNWRFEPSQEQLAQTVEATKEKLKGVPFQQLTKGVYAKSGGNTSYTIIKENEIEWLEYTFNVKGREIKIKVPRGEEPLSQELLEKIY